MGRYERCCRQSHLYIFFHFAFLYLLRCSIYLHIISCGAAMFSLSRHILLSDWLNLFHLTGFPPLCCFLCFVIFLSSPFLTLFLHVLPFHLFEDERGFFLHFLKTSTVCSPPFSYLRFPVPGFSLCYRFFSLALCVGLFHFVFWRCALFF